MNSRFILALLGWLLLPARGFCDRVIEDPITDFLRLPAKAIYSDASEVVEVHVVAVDIGGDERQEKFVGHHMMWWGDNHGWYGAFYKPVTHGFARLTPSNKLVGIDPRFFGPRSTSFCGYISEKKTQGLLVLENDDIIRNPEDPGLPPVRPQKYARRRVYFIRSNRLIADDLGPLDLATAKGRQFYATYFGGGVKSRPIRFESYPVQKLKQLGYKIPDWKKPPSSSH